MTNINTSSQIALTKIKELITQNKLLKGNKLPNERLLSEIINSKRAHVRNALLILEKEGLITRKIGNGTFLNQSSIQFIEFKDAGINKKDIQSSSFLKSIEARMSVEPIVCSSVAENISKAESKKLKSKLDLIKKSKIWLDFKVRTYDFFYCIYLLTNNKYYIHFFEEVIEDRKKLNFDGKLIQNKVSKIVVINSYLSIIKIYDAINKKKSEQSYNASKEYLSSILVSMHL